LNNPCEMCKRAASPLKTHSMHFFIKPAASLLLVAGSIVAVNTINHEEITPKNIEAGPPAAKKFAPKIQVAILLDVSNSMDGLIEQAKAQLWNMVSVMGKATCNDAVPNIEIALYEYGRPTNNVSAGYVKRIVPFTTDLDELSQNLFKLTTNGGDEYCGTVMYTSLSELQWDASPTSYKVIFIAGNEDFRQGKVSFTQACAEAKKKGVIINTIYCGDKMQGIREHWNLGAECGTGSYTNINQDIAVEEIPTPYDSTLFLLNDRLNGTYIAYGEVGVVNQQKQAAADKSNYSFSKSTAAKRVAVKGKQNLYKNSSWDLVDAATDDSTLISKVDMKTLPSTLQGKSRAELKVIVKSKTQERSNIQKEIATVSSKREAYITSERAKRANKTNQPTLETEVEKIIKTQAKRYNMVIQ
jgi:hypothetical protein